MVTPSVTPVEISTSSALHGSILLTSGPHPGLLLQSGWYFGLATFPHEMTTLDDIEQFYARNPMYEVVAPQRFLNSIQFYQQRLDPFFDYELKHGKKGKDECKYCHSSFQVEMSGVDDEMGIRVRCIRLLGRADSPKDPTWLLQ